MNAEVLSLGVAVEGIVKTQFIESDSFQEEFKNQRQLEIQSLIELDGAIDFFEKWEGNEFTKSKIISIMGNLKKIKKKKQQKTINILNHFYSIGYLTKEQITTWKEVRNASAHADMTIFNDIESIVYKSDIVLTLLYLLIFKAIGYKGIYTNYGMEDWPTVSVPNS
ncbi:hypothetical protein D1872_171150 [compost metagenome]